MPEQQEIPEVCFELLEALHQHGEPMPLRLLPEKLRDLGLLKVCQHHGLIRVVRWYEGVRGWSSGNTILVGSPPDWLPYHALGCSSLSEAIRQDAECQDVRKGLHIALSHKGDLHCETRRLSPDKTRKRAGGAAGQPKRRPGRPLDADPKQDREISEAWSAGGYQSFEEFAQTDAGRRFGKTAHELQRAHERHRKRQSRRDVK